MGYELNRSEMPKFLCMFKIRNIAIRQIMNFSLSFFTIIEYS